MFGVLVNAAMPPHVSVGLKPLPVTATFPPADTTFGLSVIEGVNALTVKVAVTVGPGTTRPPVKITVYTPVEDKVRIEPVRRPLVSIEHAGAPAVNNPVGDEVNAKLQGDGPPAPYPEPERTNDEPAPPLVGVKIKVDVTVNDAIAESPVLPLKVSV